MGALQWLAVSVVFLMLTTVIPALASSKPPFHEGNGGDLSYLLSHQPNQNIHHIFAFSNLSLVGPKYHRFFAIISPYLYKYISPLCSVDIHPYIDSSIQSENFDFTIWGQLNDYFNIDIESLAIEQEILYLYKQLDEIQRQYSIILSPHNFSLSKYQPTPPAKAALPRSPRNNDFPYPSPPTFNTSSDNLEKYPELASIVESRLITLQRQRQIFDESSDKASVQAQGQSSLEQAPASLRLTSRSLTDPFSEESNLLWRFFSRSLGLIRYMVHNKAEAMIYLSLVLLVGIFIKSLFQR